MHWSAVLALPTTIWRSRETALLAERVRWFLRLPVLIGAGVAGYFALVAYALIFGPESGRAGADGVGIEAGLRMCLWRRRWRLLGTPVMAGGIASVTFVSQPDVLQAACHTRRRWRLDAILATDTRDARRDLVATP
jgi:hypothetical protein